MREKLWRNVPLRPKWALTIARVSNVMLLVGSRDDHAQVKNCWINEQG